MSEEHQDPAAAMREILDPVVKGAVRELKDVHLAIERLGPLPELARYEEALQRVGETVLVFARVNDVYVSGATDLADLWSRAFSELANAQNKCWRARLHALDLLERAEISSRERLLTLWALVLLAQIRLPEKDRLIIVDRLRRRIGKRPIHRNQWWTVSSALSHEAAQSGRSLQTELELHVDSALFETAGDWATDSELAGLRWEDDASALQVTRRRLASKVAHDLLGPEWRRHLPEEEETRKLVEAIVASEREPLPQPDARLLSADDAATLLTKLERASLTPRELELALELAAPAGYSSPEAAGRLGIKPATARVLAHRIRKKLRAS